MKNKVNVDVFQDVEALCKSFTSLLQEELQKKEIVRLSLSGGTTPKALFNYWVKNCNKSIDWARIEFYWGDERCVPPDDEMSNFGMTKELLFDRIDAISNNQIHRIHGENEPSEEAVWYDSIINEFVPQTDSIPTFDILMLGMGDDGHTVSIFPDQISLWDNPTNCVVAKHPETGMKRISLTGRVVNQAHNIVFLVTGAGKAEKVKQVIEERSQYEHLYPAARVKPTHGQLYWFLDREAAKLL